MLPAFRRVRTSLSRNAFRQRPNWMPWRRIIPCCSLMAPTSVLQTRLALKTGGH